MKLGTIERRYDLFFREPWPFGYPINSEANIFEEFRREYPWRVIAVGPGARNEKGEIVALDVKEGDRILFGKWSGTEVKMDGEDMLIMKESDIMGILEDSGRSKKAA